MSAAAKIGPTQNEISLRGEIMPEMPEVETVRRSLEAILPGKTILRTEVRLARIIKSSDAETFCRDLAMRRIEAIKRRGKALIILFSGDLALAVHLRMTGRLYLRSEAGEKENFIRIIFFLDSGEELVYEDVRTFGTLHLVGQEAVQDLSYFKKLGPEPLSSEFTLQYLSEAMRKNKSRIKGFLLDQRKIAGLGNIYVDEALFASGIHPCRRTGDISEAEQKRLFIAVNEIIAAAIENRGTSFRDYVDGEGKKGNNQNHLKVYGRAAEPCFVCGNAIERSVVAGRGTHFCAHCQPEKA